MSNEIVRRAAEKAELIARSRRMPMSMVREIDRASFQGLRAAVRVQSAAYATHVALREIAGLTAEEGRAIELCPLGEPRYRVIVDTFTGVAAAEIAQLGY